MSNLLAVLGGLFLSIAGAVLTAQTPSDQPFLIQELGPGVWAAITNPNAKAGSVANAGFVIGDDGVIVIDTAPNAGKALLADIRQRTKLPISYVVNTHYTLITSRTTACLSRQAPWCWPIATSVSGFIRRI